MDLRDPRLQTGDKTMQNEEWMKQGRIAAKQAADRQEQHEAQGVKPPWKLVHTTSIECTMDDSGVYTVINRIEESDTHKGYIGQRVSVRCDVMSTDDEPLISFQGSANDVRKHVIGWLETDENPVNPTHPFISTEHASYIGWELHRAETDPNYVQDGC